MIILQGPPACGKSTWVKNYLEKLSKDEREKTVVVSRDIIRQSTGTYWVPSREDYISVLEDTMMEQAFVKGFDVINDATILNPKTIKHLQEIVDKYHAEVSLVKLYIPFKEAVERDRKRGENGGLSVTKKVVERFYKMYYPEQFAQEMYVDRRHVEPYHDSLPSAVICDLDGTVALHTSGRSPYDYERCDEDTPCEPMVDTLRRLADGGAHIIFVSGREMVGDCYTKTYNWICAHVMAARPFDLLMRSAGDRRKGAVLKRELYENEIKGRFNIAHVFEDNTDCVNMYRQLGLQCSQVYDLDEKLDNDYTGNK